MSQDVKILRVTMTVDYVVPMIDDKQTAINGWDIEQVKHNWFKQYDINQYHATRDSYKLGGSVKILDIQEVNLAK